VVVRPQGTTWSATAERLRVEFSVADLLQGSVNIAELTAHLVQWEDPKSGFTGTGELRIAAGRVAGTEGRLLVDTAQLSLESWHLRSTRVRADLRGELRLAGIRVPLSRGRLELKAPELQLQARVWRDETHHLPLRVSGQLGVTEGRFDRPTRLTATLAAPVEVPLRHYMLLISEGSALKLAAGTAELTVSGRCETVSLRSNASNRELLLLKDARLEPLQLASLIAAAGDPLTLKLRAAELVLDAGTAMGRFSSPLRLTTTVARHERAAWRIASASFELPRIQFAGTAGTSLRALVRLRPTDALSDEAVQLQGEIEVRGDRMGTIYPLLGIPRSVELMLAPFREQPFSGSAGLESTAAVTWLSELSVRTHTLEVQGFLRFGDGERRGALLVATPAVTLGLTLGHERNDATLRPPADWLERRLAEQLARQSQPMPP
jgi:hypothetical protein